MQSEYYAKLNRTRIYAHVHTANKASLNIHKRYAFRFVGETHFIRLLGINICYYKRWPVSAKRLHIFVKNPLDNLNAV